ncbi:MAG: hypothetical protein A2452_07305 [Candidatus Firestonebacteria bacterium RIFOXYC2_FULL_39_67]|nr:MAG: hypothetical protein A2452_07305 [Candidatus Firestonebacteria bacterium RIFOXYC2_FULL_39_67]
MAKEKVDVQYMLKGGVSKEKLLKEIEKKAYELFLKRKGTHGNDLNDWLEAEKIVKKQFKI